MIKNIVRIIVIRTLMDTMVYMLKHSFFLIIIEKFTDIIFDRWYFEGVTNHLK